jgi:hypothetical protein
LDAAAGQRHRCVEPVEPPEPLAPLDPPELLAPLDAPELLAPLDPPELLALLEPPLDAEGRSSKSDDREQLRSDATPSVIARTKGAIRISRYGRSASRMSRNGTAWTGSLSASNSELSPQEGQFLGVWRGSAQPLDTRAPAARRVRASRTTA